VNETAEKIIEEAPWQRIERHSGTWTTIVEWANGELTKHRARLETPGLPVIETEVERAHIQVLTDLLKLADPPKAVTVDTGYNFQPPSMG
tara:strand:+ start:1062 stop:1331 length:270 start_codon:yes stop_codon:yes gene_type:complete